MKCPLHEQLFQWRWTQYGMRGACPAPSCTMVSWDGNLPADALTRRLRIRAHELWRDGKLTRDECYWWLRMALKLKPKHAHIRFLVRDELDLLIAKLERGKLFLVHGGYVYAGDGDLHYVCARKVAELYRVHPSLCIYADGRLAGVRPKDYVQLHPSKEYKLCQ